MLGVFGCGVTYNTWLYTVLVHINAKSVCTVPMPSLSYARGHVGKVANDWTLMRWLYLARTLFPLTTPFCTDLVSDAQHLIVASIVC